MIILSNITQVYDGKSASKSSILEHMDLFIEDGKISRIEPHSDQIKGVEDAVRVDCQGLTVTPGLIDCHSHVTLLGMSDADHDRMNSFAAPFYIERILHTTLVDGGVTTARDVGGATHFMKRMVDEGVLIGPRLKIAICLLSTTGGVADFRGVDRCHGDMSRLFPEIPGRPSSIVDGPTACRKKVREIVACGADLVKICLSAGVASPSGTLESRAFTFEEARTVCEEANARGLRVAAHAHSKSGIEMAIECGVNDIQHISFMDERLAEKAHAKGITVTPTSWVINEIAKGFHGMTPLMKDKLKTASESHQGAVEASLKAGLKVLMGTDPVLHGMHGRNYMELTHLMREGLTPLSAWFGATGLAAREIGQFDTGEIGTGKRADLLICKGDIINQPELMDSGALLEVIKDGVGYRGHFKTIPQRTFSSALRATLEQAKASS